MNLRWAKCCDLCKHSENLPQFIYTIYCNKHGIEVNTECVCDFYEGEEE